jgi:hypothetical protein
MARPIYEYNQCKEVLDSIYRDYWTQTKLFNMFKDKQIKVNEKRFNKPPPAKQKPKEMYPSSELL